MLKEMIEDPDALREVCNVSPSEFDLTFIMNNVLVEERDGWYTSHAFEQIKTVLRHKFFSLLEGYPATDDECRALLVSSEGSLKASITQRSTKLKAGKHNMAKGALRPEDAAVRPEPVPCVPFLMKYIQAMRLRATLDRSMKSFQSQR